MKVVGIMRVVLEGSRKKMMEKITRIQNRQSQKEPQNPYHFPCLFRAVPIPNPKCRGNKETSRTDGM